MKQDSIQRLAENLWLEYALIFPKLVRFDCPKIVLNNRFTKTAGCNHCEHNQIDLASKFLAKFQRNMLTVILPHELAHQIDYNLNGWEFRKLHHGKQWATIMVKIGQEPNPYHSMEL